MIPLVYYDQIHLYGKNLEQEKYRHMIETIKDISSPVGYDIMHCKRVSMGWWPLRLSAKILALLRLSVNFFQLRLTKKLKINFFCFKKLNIN